MRYLRAEIKLLSVSENGRPPFWNCISGFYLLNLYHRRVILHWPTIFLQNRTTLIGVMNDVISIFQDGGQQLYWM